MFLALHLGNSQPLPGRADFRGPPLTSALARQSSSDVVKRARTGNHQKHSVSVLPSLPPPLWLPLPKDLVRILLRFLISKRYSCPSSLSMTSSLPASLSTKLTVQISHSHRIRATGTGFDTSENMRTHLLESGNRYCRAVNSLCQEHRRSHILGQHVFRCALDVFVQGFPMLEERETGLRA